MSNILPLASGRVRQPIKYERTSRIAIGWLRVLTQRGHIMTGSRSTKALIISKDALPEPMIMAARNSVVATEPALRMSPT